MRTRRSSTVGGDPLPSRASTDATSGVARLKRELEADLVARLSDDTTVAAIHPGRTPAPWRPRLKTLLADAAGARIVFNAVSQGYLETAGPGEAAHQPGLGLRLDELIGAAADAGRRVGAVVPYGALLGHPSGGESLLAPLDRTYRWRRAVSWLARDDELLALVRFLEHRLVAHLPTRLAPYLMVALDPAAGAADAPDWLARDREADAAVAELSLTALADRAGAAAADLAADLDPLLARLKPRLLLFAVLDQLADRVPGFDTTGLLTPVRAQQYEDWRRANRIDRDVAALGRQWAAEVPQRMVDGVDATLAVDYRLIRVVLEDYLDRFDEVQR